MSPAFKTVNAEDNPDHENVEAARRDERNAIRRNKGIEMDHPEMTGKNPADGMPAQASKPADPNAPKMPDPNAPTSGSATAGSASGGEGTKPATAPDAPGGAPAGQQAGSGESSAKPEGQKPA